MAEFKKVTKRNHRPDRGTDNQFLVYSTQFNELVEALNDGTGDLNVNDAVVTGDLTVTGTSTFNGAIVLGDAAADALTINATVTQGAPVNYSNATTITAFATGGQASATALTEEINNVTTVATAGDSVKLPAAVAGMHIYVKNSGATALDIFPATSDSIDALAVNLAIRIQPGSSINFYAKDATVWESNIDETFTLMAPTTNTGALVLKAVASAGNFNTQIQNASQAAARVYTIPDAGANASFVQTEGAQTINGVKTFGDTTDASSKDTGAIVTEGGIGVEKAVNIGTTLTVGTTSSLVGVVTFGAGNIYKALTTQTALAGGAQAGTALTAEYTNFTVVATALDSAQLPTPVLGTRRIVKNSATSKLAMVVFGQTGADIDGGATNAGVIIGYGEEVVFDAISATAWKTNRNSPVVSSIITEERTLTATEIVGTAAGDLGHASGAELVSAPGAGYMLEFISAVCMYDFDTAAYTGGANDTSIRIGSGGAALTGAVTDANSLTAAGDKIYSFVPLSTAALPLSTNTGISMNATTAYTQPGTAAGVLRVQTSYRIHKTGL